MINKNKLKLPVLNETAQDLIVVKPAGMASQLTSDPHASSLISRVRAACPPQLQAELPHRLDRITRGLMVISLCKEATVFHNEMIREKRWQKYYLARVSCKTGDDPHQLLGLHKAFLKQKGGKAEVVRSGGKPALLEILHISPATGRKNEFHLLIKLLTGRFHQIRVMLANLGYPLTDDFLYDDRKNSNSKQRGKEDFYLEAIILKYINFETKKAQTVFYENDPEREKTSPEMMKAIHHVLDTDAD